MGHIQDSRKRKVFIKVTYSTYYQMLVQTPHAEKAQRNTYPKAQTTPFCTNQAKQYHEVKSLYITHLCNSLTVTISSFIFVLFMWKAEQGKGDKWELAHQTL